MKPLEWMVLGTGPASAKTCVALGLARLLRDRGVHVAPFKAIAVMHPEASPAGMGRSHCAAGAIHLIGAAGVAAEPTMNPVTIWPAGAGAGEMVVMGEPAGPVELLNRDAIRFERLSARQRAQIGTAIRAAHEELRSRFEAIVIEGAGSPIEADEEQDWANQRVLRESGAQALLVARFSNGGAAAALVGTLACMAPELRRRVRGLILSDVPDDDAARHAASLATRHTGLPILGLVPRLDHGIDGREGSDYEIAYSAWADALAAHLDLSLLGDVFAAPA